MNRDIFKAYDIRGVYPTEINEEVAKKIAKAYATWLRPQKVAVGRDVRVSGPSLWQAFTDGLTEMGVDVVDLGVISTDMLYFAVANYDFDGGVTISASHNAGEYNGMKFVREGSRPISIDTGLAEIRDLVETNNFEQSARKGSVESLDILDDYIAKMVSFIDKKMIVPLKVVANPNFGAAGKAVQHIADYFGVELIKLNFEENGEFPKGKPDPMQPAVRQETVELTKNSNVIFGATWDADADRCFFFDERGDFILPIYVTGILMEYFLEKERGKILVDPRLTWLPQSIATKFGIELLINKSGHSFIKDRMRAEDAVFGAETSAHYYFKDLWFTDNGMVPFMIMLEVVSKANKPLSEIVKKYREKFYAIEETNFTVESVAETLENVKSHYLDGQLSAIDGISIEFPDWRFNLRGSNTEPVIRLNLEAKNRKLGEEKFAEIASLITN